MCSIVLQFFSGRRDWGIKICVESYTCAFMNTYIFISYNSDNRLSKLYFSGFSDENQGSPKLVRESSSDRNAKGKSLVECFHENKNIVYLKQYFVIVLVILVLFLITEIIVSEVPTAIIRYTHAIFSQQDDKAHYYLKLSFKIKLQKLTQLVNVKSHSSIKLFSQYHNKS